MSLLNPMTVGVFWTLTSAAVEAKVIPAAKRHGNTTVASFKCGIR
jgi:hypothetical protein